MSVILERRSPLRRAAGLLLGWCLVVVLSPAAQSQDVAETPPEESSAEAEEFFEIIDVDVVNIDVWVTDRDGSPISGLTREDFVVRRDGQPAEVTNFYAVSGGIPEGGAGLPGEGATAETPIVTGQDPFAETLAEEHRLWLIVYVDNYNLDAIERRRVIPGLQEFLARTLKGDDRAMVVTYDRALEVVQPFTSSTSELFYALEATSGETGHAGLQRREQADTLQRIDRARDAGRALGWARQYAEEQLDAVERTTDALERMVESLAGLPGRKALIHVSSGIPMLPGEEMFQAVGEKFNASEAYAEIPRHDASRMFEKIGRAANAHRVSFMTLDAGGMRGLHFAGAEYAGFVNPRLRRTLDSIVPENMQSPLRFIAGETGGHAILNVNEAFPALQKAALDFRSFYSLGISSLDAEAGRYHEIKVELATPNRKWKVRHRGGYRSKDVDTKMREALRTALLYAHQTNPLGLEVLWGEPERQADSRQYILPIQLRLPMRDVVFLPISGSRHETRLRLFVAVAGMDGELSEIDDAPLGLRLADEYVEAAKAEELRHLHKLRLAPGRKKVAVGIVDLFGHEISVVTGVLDVGTAAAN